MLNQISERYPGKLRYGFQLSYFDTQNSYYIVITSLEC